MNDTTFKIEHCGAPAWVWMNRPDVHNAFDETLIAELTNSFTALDRYPAVSAIVLAGVGKSFSAGADLNWMKRQGAAPLDANLSDARKLAMLFRTISMCATPEALEGLSAFREKRPATWVPVSPPDKA